MVKSVRDPKESSRKWTRTMKAQHEMASWALVRRRSFFLSEEKYNGRVDFDGHSPEWRVLSKCSIQRYI